MISRESIKSKVKFEEGFEPKAYRCSAGKLTIGFGYNLDAPGAKVLIDRLKLDWEGVRSGKVEITKTQAGILMEAKIEGALKGAMSVCPSFLGLSDRRQLVLVDMCYQMGTEGLRDFENMLKAITVKNFKLAADELMSSKYARKDSPNRAKRNRELMLAG